MSLDRESEYGEDARRALAHITGRTRQGSFAAPLYNWPAERWAAAIEPLERAGIVKSGIATAADDPTVTRGWVLVQPAAGPGDEPSHEQPPDTGHYGSHDVTPRERESWDGETEPQDRAETSPTGDIAADPGAAVAMPDLGYGHLQSHRAGQEAQRLNQIATGGTPPRPARTTTPPSAQPVRLAPPSQQPSRRR